MNKKLSLIRLGVLIMGLFVVGLSYGKPTEQSVQVETLDSISQLLHDIMKKSTKLVQAHESNNQKEVDRIKKDIHAISRNLQKTSSDVHALLKKFIDGVCKSPTQENLQSLAAAVNEQDALIMQATTEDIAAKTIALSGGNPEVIEAQVANVNRANEKAQEASWYNTIVNGASSAWTGVKDYFLDDQKSIARKGLEIAAGTAALVGVGLATKYGISRLGSETVTTELPSAKQNLTLSAGSGAMLPVGPGAILPAGQGVVEPVNQNTPARTELSLVNQNTPARTELPLVNQNTPATTELSLVNQNTPATTELPLVGASVTTGMLPVTREGMLREGTAGERRLLLEELLREQTEDKIWGLQMQRQEIAHQMAKAVRNAKTTAEKMRTQNAFKRDSYELQKEINRLKKLLK